MHTARAIARLLKAEGIPVRGFAEGDEMVDGEVTISDAVHVQVPSLTDDLPLVCRWSPDREVLYTKPVPSLRSLPAEVRLAEAEANRKEARQ